MDIHFISIVISVIPIHMSMVKCWGQAYPYYFKVNLTVQTSKHLAKTGAQERKHTVEISNIIKGGEYRRHNRLLIGIVHYWIISTITNVYSPSLSTSPEVGQWPDKVNSSNHTKGISDLIPTKFLPG